MRKVKADVQPQEAEKILSQVPPDRAFHFYAGMGVPIGLTVRSLKEFINIIQIVDSKSLEFHILRGDFENWITMLGDKPLAKQIGRFRKLGIRGETLRERLLQTLTERYKVLKEAK